jgi:hypothetical protein
MNSTLHKSEQVHDIGATFAGLFEAHVTVRAHDAQAHEHFAALCAQHRIKPVLIQLPTGAVQSQPMTCSIHRGTVQQALSEAHQLARLLEAAKFPVLRVKLEAAPFNADVPQTDAQAQALSSTFYFEHHLKLLLPEGHVPEELVSICAEHHAHLSSNARKLRDDGKQERFVTVRRYATCWPIADTAAKSLSAVLSKAGIEVDKMVGEYCVYDSDVRVDSGWIEP